MLAATAGAAAADDHLRNRKSFDRLGDDDRDALIARYGDLHQRMGSTGEHDSVINQLYFFVALLPADKKSTTVKEALLRMIEGIKKA